MANLVLQWLSAELGEMFIVSELETTQILIDNRKAHRLPWLKEWLKLNKMTNMKLSFQLLSLSEGISLFHL